MVVGSFSVEMESSVEAKRLWKYKDKIKMVVGSFSVEMESSVEAKRLWKAAVKDSHTLLPKQAPEIFSGVTVLQGDGGVGTIVQYDFTPANKEYSYIKERVDKIDEDNLVYGFSHVEGGVVGTKLASVSYQVKFSPKAGGGSIAIYTCNFDSLPGIPHDEAKIEEIKNHSSSFLKLLEAHLIANPTLYS